MPKQSFVICTDNSGYEVSLEVRKVYAVLPDPDAAAHDQLRVVDESGDDYLYPKSFFASLDIPQRIARQLFHAA